LTDSEIGETDL